MSEDLSRRVGDLVRVGRVVEVAGKRVRVEVDGVETAPIKIGLTRAGRLKVWARPKVGEQVLLYTPDGDLERAIAGQSIPTAEFADPDDALDFIEFEDGGRVSYDHDAQLLAVAVAAGGRIELTAPAGLVIKGDVLVDGDVVVDGDVITPGISLRGHRHPNTEPPIGAGV